MAKQKSSGHAKKEATPKHRLGSFVLPEKKGQTTQVHKAIRSTGTMDKPMKPMTGEERRRHSSFTKIFPVVSYGDNERVSFEAVSQLGDRFSYSLPKTLVQHSLPENPVQRTVPLTFARSASPVRAAKSAQRSARAASRDFGDVLELDGDKVVSVDVDALDGYGERRAAFYIKKLAAV